ncbi:hypothetical protein HYV31_00510 [candidate division WWE3 bacterium]|nr:hypothetical protein [candidate division WWE3 bacterium]
MERFKVIAVLKDGFSCHALHENLVRNFHSDSGLVTINGNDSFLKVHEMQLFVKAPDKKRVEDELIRYMRLMKAFETISVC